MHDIDFEIADQGVLVPGPRPIALPWVWLEAVCSASDPMSPSALRRLLSLVEVARRIAQSDRSREYLSQHVVAMALPADHVDHLGTAWTQRVLPGGVLHLGLGLRDAAAVIHLSDGGASATMLPGSGHGTLPISPVLLAHLGYTGAADSQALAGLWADAVTRTQEMSKVAAQYLGQERVLRPVGGCDVLSLLVGSTFRRVLADMDGTGLAAVAVPNRHHGWFDLTRVDPEYVALAWQLTDERERGLPAPALVTRDEVLLPRSRGRLNRPATQAP